MINLVKLVIHASYEVAPMELFDVCYVYYMSMIFICPEELIFLLFCASEGSIVMMFLPSQILAKSEKSVNLLNLSMLV